jgi:RNA polymerase sigma-70 factor (ECF subfamily)
MSFPRLSADEQARLVALIREGDRGAEGRLVELFSRAVRLMVRVRARGLDDEDLAQEVLMNAITALRRGQLRDPERLGHFVSGIARNVINNRLRSQRGPAFESIDDHEHAGAADLTEELARRQRAALVRRALDDLSAEDRRILILTLVEGLKSGQIAERLGLGEEVVRTRKSRAIKRLKARLGT